MAESEAPKPGLRVGVFHSMTDETLLLLGFGIYEGDEIPPEDILAPYGPPALLHQAIPKLRLDDGTVVWGCECWWHAEETVLGYKASRTVVRPKIDSIRQKAREAWEKANKQLDQEEERLP